LTDLKENARAARVLKDDGGCRGSSVGAVTVWYMDVVGWDLRGGFGKRSSSGWSWSSEEGRVEVELCRAEALELS
jgi:hypothetical protein